MNAQGMVMKKSWELPEVEVIGGVTELTSEGTKPKSPTGTTDDFGFPRSI